jgi:hypothetical protein
VEFLSTEWFEAANTALAELDTAEAEIIIEQQVHDDESPVCYQLVVEQGRARLDPRAFRTPDVVFRQSRATAFAVRAGQINALDAVQDGRISVDGDPLRLVASLDAVMAVDRIVAGLDI